MDSEKGNRVFARGHNVPPPLVFGAQKKPGLDRVKLFQIGPDALFNIRRAIELRNRSQAYELTSVVQDVHHFLYVHILGQDDRGPPFVRFGDHEPLFHP